MTNPEFVSMLREMADFMKRLETKRPGEVPIASVWHSYANRWEFQALSKEEMRTYAGIFGGHLEKELIGDYLKLVKKLNTCEIELWALRDRVCERIVTGKQFVRKEVPIQFESREIEEEVVEWRCPESFLA